MSEMGVSTDGIRIYLNSFSIGLYGLLDSPAGHQCVPKISMRCRVILIELYNSLEAFDGVFNLLDVKERQSQLIMSLSVVGINLYNLTIALPSLL